ncbi:hypothetical protein Y1Q_0017271 [Alligator mississippiensis]|uniref:Uncharacterized protein n=1 Tax=Alligator mississippiensis TaxID=8496 RepID=A0A151NKY7_ALLMI|nr:hypothetical protein Y1Q_0017271 [Alligator mississippiensis]
MDCHCCSPKRPHGPQHLTMETSTQFEDDSLGSVAFIYISMTVSLISTSSGKEAINCTCNQRCRNLSKSMILNHDFGVLRGHKLFEECSRKCEEIKEV